MEPNAFVHQRLDDIVFENRNKEYGAYVLRKTYSDKVLVGFFASLCLVGMLFFLPSETKDKIKSSVPELMGNVEFTPPPFVDARKLKPSPPSRQEVVERNDVPPRVVSDPVETQPITTTVQSSANGEGEEVTSGGETTITGTGVHSDIPVVETPKPDFVLAAEVMPTYEGGYEGLMKFVKKKLRYPASAVRLHQEGTVYIAFIVNGDGTIRNVEVVKGFFMDCDKEAMRVISMLPGWKGGSHGGQPVAVRMVLPITFKLSQ
jgi:periplasmic protein TonB